MTRDELLARLRGLGSATGDIDGAHMKADELLLEWINDPEITAAYNSFEKWFA